MPYAFKAGDYARFIHSPMPSAQGFYPFKAGRSFLLEGDIIRIHAIGAGVSPNLIQYASDSLKIALISSIHFQPVNMPEIREETVVRIIKHDHIFPYGTPFRVINPHSPGGYEVKNIDAVSSYGITVRKEDVQYIVTPGDTFKVSSWPHKSIVHPSLTPGNKITIDKVEMSDINIYFKYPIEHGFSNMVPDSWLYWAGDNSQHQSEKCSCTMQTLMRTGCNCGHLKNAKNSKNLPAHT